MRFILPAASERYTVKALYNWDSNAETENPEESS